ncbi:MAG: phosphotransferase family protein, partial [Pseudomonadota bacterium]
MDAVGVNSVMENPPFDLSNLEAYLRQEVSGFGSLDNLSVFKGGQSNPTFLVESASRRFVLRKKPPGKLLPSAHAVDREHRVMSALGHADIPVPTMYCLCLDRNVIGTEFYVMDYMEGRILWSAELPEVSQESRPEYYQELTRVLAKLHSVPFRDVGLSDFGKEGNYFARQIGRWSKQYRASEIDHNQSMHGL